MFVNRVRLHNSVDANVLLEQDKRMTEVTA
jgi:hypothetical protein